MGFQSGLVKLTSSVPSNFENKIVPITYQPSDSERLSWTLPLFQMVDFTRTFDEGCADLSRIWGLGYEKRV